MATANIFRGETGQQAYYDILTHVLKHGERRTPRGQVTLDAGYSIIELDSPRNALPLHTGRGINVNIAAAEAVQLIGGFSQPSLLTRAAKSFAQYMDDDKFYGAYGRRVGGQAAACINKLKHDPQTRQAIISLWDPFLDNQPGKHDYPCTVMLQFEIRDEHLCMNVVMRSNDAWLGLPYDLFQFGQLQLSMARALQFPAGTYRHTAMSLHVYEKDALLADAVHPPRVLSAFQPVGVGRSMIDTYTDIMKRARQLTVLPFDMDADATTSERWYRERFAAYMGPDVDGDSKADGTAEHV